MNIKQQFEAADKLLQDRGIDEEERAFFRKAALVLVQNSVGMLANKFETLLKVAKKNGDKDDDSKAVVTFEIEARMDCTDIEQVHMNMSLSFSDTVKYKEKASAEVKVDTPDDYLGTDPELPLQFTPPLAQPSDTAEPVVITDEDPLGVDEEDDDGDDLSDDKLDDDDIRYDADGNIIPSRFAEEPSLPETPPGETPAEPEEKKEDEPVLASDPDKDVPL